MKSLFTFWGIFIFLIALCGCESKEQNNHTILFPEIQINEFVSSSTQLSNLFKEYNTIHLETKDECLIGGVSNKIIKKKSAIYVSSMNDILIFDDKGIFITKLSKMGIGPEEYDKILDFDIVSDYNEIWVSSSKGIVRYKIPSLEFCGIIKLNFYAKKIKYLGNEEFIALTPDDKVFNICSIEGKVLESYYDKDLANSGEKIVQFVKVGDNIIAQLANNNSAVCFNIKSKSFSIKDVISPDIDNIETIDINRQYYDKYGYLDFSQEVMKEYIGIIGFRKVNGQTILSLRYPGPELAVVIDNGTVIKEYVVKPSDKSPLVDDIFDGQDPLFLMSFAAGESDDSFIFIVPNENPDFNPSLLEVTKFN